MEARRDCLSEAQEVLNKYLGLFQQSSIVFKYHLAPNSVIDWYGRTVHGANKIHDYMRHEIHNQFDHIEFSEPAECSPIEVKTSHMRTKIISFKPIDNVHPINRVPDMVPLKSYADSDVEDSEQPMSSRFVGVGYRHTPENCISTLPIGGLTPPASAKKDDKQSEDEEGGDTKEHENGTCLKRKHTGRFKYLKRLPTAASSSKRPRSRNTPDGIRTLLDDTSSEEDDLEIMEALYTPLRYLEVNGLIKINPSSNRDKPNSALWRDQTQLETRIRISYRRKLEDQQIEFALIIYEALNGTSMAAPVRRNLMAQFTMSVDEPPPQSQQGDAENDSNEHFVQETVHETVPTMISIPQATTSSIFDQDIDPLQEDSSTLEALSPSQMRTPTKFAHTPPATPKRKPRSLFTNTSGLKRINSSPSTPTPKRSAVRSLRL